MNDVQAVVEILAERLVRDAVDQNAVGRGDDANIDPVLNLIRSDALDFSGLEKSEEQALHSRARLAHLIHKHGAAVRLFESPKPIAIRAGEAAAHMAKELRLEKSLGQRRAVDGDERGSAAWTSCVNQARDDLLPCPALASDQHFGVTLCGVKDLFLEREDGWTRTNEFRGLHRRASCQTTEVAFIAPFWTNCQGNRCRSVRKLHTRDVKVCQSAVRLS